MRKTFPSVAEVEAFEVRGPWTTKSGGELNVLFALPYQFTEQFFSYDTEELGRIPCDIRGLRSYTVRGLPVGGIGGTEFHRIRSELLFCLEGEVAWEFEDVLGTKRSLVLTRHHGVFFPPFILHTYRVRAQGSGSLTVVNTLFDPDDPRTHDTYSTEQFRELQQQAAGRS